jgi:hypothetical protein
MDFGDTPAAKLTKRIMAEISGHLKDDAPDYAWHYNNVYSCIHRNVLAYGLVAKLAEITKEHS